MMDVRRISDLKQIQSQMLFTTLDVMDCLQSDKLPGPHDLCKRARVTNCARVFQ